MPETLALRLDSASSQCELWTIVLWPTWRLRNERAEHLCFAFTVCAVYCVCVIVCRGLRAGKVQENKANAAGRDPDPDPEPGSNSFTGTGSLGRGKLFSRPLTRWLIASGRSSKKKGEQSKRAKGSKAHSNCTLVWDKKNFWVSWAGEHFKNQFNRYKFFMN